MQSIDIWKIGERIKDAGLRGVYREMLYVERKKDKAYIGDVYAEYKRYLNTIEILHHIECIDMDSGDTLYSRTTRYKPQTTIMETVEGSYRDRIIYILEDVLLGDKLVYTVKKIEETRDKHIMHIITNQHRLEFKDIDKILNHLRNKLTQLQTIINSLQMEDTLIKATIETDEATVKLTIDESIYLSEGVGSQKIEEWIDNLRNNYIETPYKMMMKYILTSIAIEHTYNIALEIYKTVNTETKDILL